MRTVNATLDLAVKFKYAKLNFRPLSIISSLLPGACGADPPVTELRPNLIPPAVVGLPITEQLTHMYMFPRRLTYLMEWNLTSGGEETRRAVTRKGYIHDSDASPQFA